MNIVFFIQNFSRSGGSERVTSLIANFMSEQGHSVTVVSICGDNTCFYPLNISVRLITLINKQEVDNKSYFFYVLNQLRKFYADNNIDLVIDVFAALSIYTLLLKKKYRYKNITWEHFNFHVNTGANKIGRKLAVRFSDAIVTLTNEDKGYYCDKYPKAISKLHTIYNPSPYPNAEIGKEKKKMVLSVGRLTRQKKFATMLDIWKCVQQNHPEWKLLILGNGEDREKLELKIHNEEISNIEMPGAVKNIEEYYRKAAIYISTSLYEGLPMTMIEAQSFGLPIITFNFETGPADIVKNGENGYVIQRTDNLKNDMQNMAHAIDTLINNPTLRNEYSDNAKKDSERFTMKQIGKCWTELLREIEY